MKANELMLGDWVYVPHGGSATHYGRVCGIYEREVVSTTLEKDSGLTKASALSPILLTSEILEKNGFERLGSGYILLGHPFGLTNPSTPDDYKDNYWLRVAASSVNIKYVHELQHALRLCEIDKGIVL